MSRFIKLYAMCACLLAVNRPGFADTVLAGSDLSHPTSVGAGLCPMASDCSVLAQQFTLQGAVLIDQIDLVLSAPDLFPVSSYPFSAEIENTLGNPAIGGTFVGSGNVAVPSNGNYTTQQFDFTGLNIALGTGTYYLVVQGGDVAWNYAPALTTSSGSLGSDFACDPQLNCTPGRWDTLTTGVPFAVDIDGTPFTPEPSSWLLFGTGLLTAVYLGRRGPSSTT